MPGVVARACSLTTKVCQAASSGRGRAVTITVSSMSDTIPKRSSGSTTKHVRRGDVEPSELSPIWCQPGDRSTSTLTSMMPLESACTVCTEPPDVHLDRRRSPPGR